MNNSEQNSQTRPLWADGKNPDERRFCWEFRLTYRLVYYQGSFYNVDGYLPEEKVRKWVYDMLYNHYSTGLVKKTNQLTEALKMDCAVDRMDRMETTLHLANGTYYLAEQRFTREKEICMCRLPVNWNENAPWPEKWMNFVYQLLAPEDVLTLQQYFGYCLLPVTYAQKMLLIVGQGGEGKSRVGIIARALLGDNMVNGSLTKLENNRFARADLQNKLLMVDDDLQLEALTTTGHIKSIITAEQPLDLEQKGKQSYQAELFCRLMAFGNGNLRSLHDRSYGFFRRQIILTALPRPRDRVDDPFLAVAMRKELEGILQWAVQGLMLLIEDGMKFTLSTQALENLRLSMAESCNIMDFLASEGYVQREPMGEISSRKLYDIYREWCEDNALTPLVARSFAAWLIENGRDYGIQYTTHISTGGTRRVRGFLGIREFI